jgi:hypothetical protein
VALTECTSNYQHPEYHTMIRTNHHPRHVIYGYELPKDARREFDYLQPDDLDTTLFVRYKGEYYDLHDTEPCPFDEYERMVTTSAWTAILFRLDDDLETVVCATFIHTSQD